MLRNWVITLPRLTLAASLAVACNATPKVGSQVLQSGVNGSIKSDFIVSGLTPSAVLPGASVTVNGVGLSSDVTVTIGGAAAAVTSRSTAGDSLTVTVPDGKPGMQPVVLTKQGDVASLNPPRRASRATWPSWRS